jgi:hypothetical protein
MRICKCPMSNRNLKERSCVCYMPGIRLPMLDVLMQDGGMAPLMSNLEAEVQGLGF